MSNELRGFNYQLLENALAQTFINPGNISLPSYNNLQQVITTKSQLTTLINSLNQELANTQMYKFNRNQIANLCSILRQYMSYYGISAATHNFYDY